jgi:phosphotransferase system enzyme I (PtsI)
MSIKIEKGIIASPGIRIGKAFVLSGDKIIIKKYSITEDSVEPELARFRAALEQTKLDIMDIQKQIASNLNKEMSDIFTSHLMILEDPVITDRAAKVIREEKRNVEWVINDITLELINSLSVIEDEYLRERIIDITDISKRLIGNLQKTTRSTLAEIDEEVILFAPDLTPSETALMNKSHILAFVTDKGGRTSHTAIMARALDIPAIVGTINSTSMVKNGDTIIVDAVHGIVIINPDNAEIEEYKKSRADFEELEKELEKLQDLSSQTIDGVEISIFGNIEIPEETRIIRDHGAAGIGLFRSEFLFLDKSLPDEEKQFNEYKKVVEFFNPAPVTIRTIDVGGDKVYAYTNAYKERNPFLGCRAIRFSLQNIDLFKIQLRAILRASAFGNVKLMFPMITTIEEIKQAKALTIEIMNDLRNEKIPFDEKIEIGIMIEVPSAVVLADVLAKYVDFFSVGTNDLVQYLLAVDRISEKIAYMYNPLNLSVLRFLKQLVDVSKKHKVPVSICGEIAGEPQYTIVLLGLGFRDLSMSPTHIYQVKKIIRSVTVKECEEFVKKLMTIEDTDVIEEEVRKIFRTKFKDILV